MGTESIEASFLSIFALISFFIFLLVSKYSNKIRGGALLDKDFLKPQAFHDDPITRSGGVAAIISLSIFFVIYYLLYSQILYDYIFISYSMFLVGFLDDLKINIKPSNRLITMVLLLFLFIYSIEAQHIKKDNVHVRDLQKSFNSSKKNILIISKSSLYSVTLIGLNELWYKKYPKSLQRCLNAGPNNFSI